MVGALLSQPSQRRVQLLHARDRSVRIALEVHVDDANAAPTLGVPQHHVQTAVAAAGAGGGLAEARDLPERGLPRAVLCLLQRAGVAGVAQPEQNVVEHRRLDLLQQHHVGARLDDLRQQRLQAVRPVRRPRARPLGRVVVALRQHVPGEQRERGRAAIRGGAAPRTTASRGVGAHRRGLGVVACGIIRHHGARSGDDLGLAHGQFAAVVL